ncbi:MAG: MBL fold metallo-hydrolase [Acidobacteria bacterium]|nr:MBL fold metallo-hydrolase [Acidobacteriota bacterium]
MTPPRVVLHWLRVGRCRHPEWVTLCGGRWGAVDFPAHCALIVHPTFGPILYDTGYADRFETETHAFPARLHRWVTPVRLPANERLGVQLARIGVHLEDVGRVVISHLHADHVAGLRDLPRARFMALRDDVAGSLGHSGWGALRRGYLPGLLPADFSARLDFADDRAAADLGPRWAPFERGLDLLGDGSMIGVPLSGHSPAQLGLVLPNADGRPVMLVADACWSTRAWRENRLPSALVRPIVHDWGRYRRTLAGIHRLGSNRPDLRILPSHCREAWAAVQVPLHDPHHA